VLISCKILNLLNLAVFNLEQQDLQNAKQSAQQAKQELKKAQEEAKKGNLGEGKTVGEAKGTGYYPDSSAMEGGYVDKKGKKLNTLQDYLNGKAPYVSIALDKNLYKSGAVNYGDTFRIPQLEQKYGQQIPFKAVDTGGAFTNKGSNRVDICTRSRKDNLDPTVNGHLTLQKVSR